MSRLVWITAALAPLLVQVALAQGQFRAQAPLAAAASGDGLIAIEAESLLGSSITTHGRAGFQDMRSFGTGWSRDGQLFWGGTRVGAQLRLTFRTVTTGRYQVYLRYTRAPDFALVRASFDGAPPVSLNGYAPTVTHERALLGMLDLTPGLRELLIEVVMKDGKSSGLNVGLDRIELEPVVEGQQTRLPSSHQWTQDKRTRVASELLLPMARLAFATANADGSITLGGTELKVYGSNLRVRLGWETNAAPAMTYSWQVANQPFPSGRAPDLAPSGLLAEGSATRPSFLIDLGSFPPLGTGALTAGDRTSVVVNPQVAGRVTERPSNKTRGSGAGSNVSASGPILPDHPMDFYIRILPVVAGKAAGPPSNTVVAHYVPGPDPSSARTRDALAESRNRAAKLAEMKVAAQLYQLSLLKFEPMVLADPSRWGCIYVIKNPYAMKVHPLGGYQAGKEYCGEPYAGMSYQGSGLGDALSAWAEAYDILAKYYDEAKAWVAGVVANLAPCEAMGDQLEGNCEDFVEEVTASAISAGLAAAGVPPTLPSLSELQAAAEGKAVEAAVNFTCHEFETRGGQCTPEMRMAIAAAYQKGIDQIQKGIVRAANEPGCGDTQAAHDHGREPLPCFTDFPGVEVQPAAGAVSTPATVKVRVQRVKPNPPFFLPACRLVLDLDLRNHFPGANIGGIDYPATPLQGHPFEPAEAAVPPLSLGKTADLTLVFTRIRPFAVPGHYNPTIWWDDWLYLYLGGRGPLTAASTTISPVPGAQELNGTTVPLACSPGAKTTVQVPK